MRAFNYSAIREQKWDSEILGLVAAIYKEAGKQELYLKQRPEELEKLVEIAKVQSTEASNAIEGIVTTNTRIRQLVEEKTTPRNRDEQEIAGYRDVLTLIHEDYDAIPITRNYILQLHKILYSHMNNPMAGRTKSVQNYISATYPDGHVETLFTPLAPYETPEALDRICEEYNRVIGNMEVEPLIVIPVFIHDFLCIHPFNDGNGRMSRLLTTLLLYRSGFYVDGRRVHDDVRDLGQRLRRICLADCPSCIRDKLTDKIRNLDVRTACHERIGQMQASCDRLGAHRLARARLTAKQEVPHRLARGGGQFRMLTDSHHFPGDNVPVRQFGDHGVFPRR